MRTSVPTVPQVREEEVQRQVIAFLRQIGYTVLQTTIRLRIAGRKGSGADKGVPDLLVTRLDWPAPAWLGIEVKKPGPIKWSSPEQEQLHLQGLTAKAQSIEDACAAVLWIERCLGYESNRNVVRLGQQGVCAVYEGVARG